jgi:hypothetical protein
MTAKMKLLVPMLKIASDSLLEIYSREHAPTIPEVSAFGNKQHPGAMAEMFQTLLGTCIHEEGHAALMRHLNPACSPNILLRIGVELREEGVGLALGGGEVGAGCMFDDPHENAAISVAGFLAELVSLPAVMVEEFPDLPANPFAKLNGKAAAGMVLSSVTEESFPGSADDFNDLRGNVLKFKGIPADDNLAKALDDVPESEREAFVESVGEFVANACSTALRVLHADRVGIVARAVDRAKRVTAVVAEQSAIIGGAADRVRGAGLGYYTQEAVAAAAVKDDDDEPTGQVWKK